MKKKYKQILAVILFLIIWDISAIGLDMNFLLPRPYFVLLELFKIFTNNTILIIIMNSIKSIMAGLILSFIIGIIFSLLSSRFEIIKIMISPYITIIKSTPVASFIILFIVLLSNKYITTFISFLMCFPIVYSNFLEGINSIDKNLTGMSKVYKMSTSNKFLYIYLPHLKPFLESSINVCVGLAFKSGIATEVIGLPKNTIGEKMYDAKIYLETTNMIALTIIVVVFSIILEKVLHILINAFYKKLYSK
ncbi:MAG: ABC transporter permease subunit [Eubacteriales bacterium]|nr:ABC transporter permease subunit [Eubacteriales bacterium]